MFSANQESALTISNAVAAGVTTSNSSSVDMAGYEGCKFYIKFGAIVTGAATSIKVQQSSDDGSSDAFADLAGTSQTVADDDDNKVFVIDIYRPQERYLRTVVSRATQNSTIESIVAVRYGAKKLPATDDSTTVGGRECHASPAEGTA